MKLPPLYSPSGKAERRVRNTCGIARCHHIRANGVQCGSPALHGKRLCYFHSTIRRPVASNRLPILEDAESVQCALMQVMRGILDKTLDRQTAGLLLYALQTAHANLRHLHFQPSAWNVVRDLSGAIPHMEDSPVPPPVEDNSGAECETESERDEEAQPAAEQKEAAQATNKDCQPERSEGPASQPLPPAKEAPSTCVAADATPSAPEQSETELSDEAYALRTAIQLARAYVIGEITSGPKPRKKRARRAKSNADPSTAPGSFPEGAGLRSG